jgi:hypothetical protein
MATVGAIPRLLNPRDQMRKRMQWGSAIAAFAVASVIVAATIFLKR